MSTSLKRQNCGYVTINAAFLQEVKEAYCSLWECVCQMRQAALNGLPLSVDMNPWVNQLTELRGQLASEFGLEETYGYITSAARPCLGAPIDPSMTLGQHAELYLQLSEICEQVEEAQYSGTLLRDFPTYSHAFFAFADSLQEHERNEARLIEHGLGIVAKKP